MLAQYAAPREVIKPRMCAFHPYWACHRRNHGDGQCSGGGCRRGADVQRGELLISREPF